MHVVIEGWRHVYAEPSGVCNSEVMLYASMVGFVSGLLEALLPFQCGAAQHYKGCSVLASHFSFPKQHCLPTVRTPCSSATNITQLLRLTPPFPKARCIWSGIVLPLCFVYSHRLRSRPVPMSKLTKLGWQVQATHA